MGIRTYTLVGRAGRKKVKKKLKDQRKKIIIQLIWKDKDVQLPKWGCEGEDHEELVGRVGSCDWLTFLCIHHQMSGEWVGGWGCCWEEVNVGQRRAGQTYIHWLQPFLPRNAIVWSVSITKERFLASLVLFLDREASLLVFPA